MLEIVIIYEDFSFISNMINNVLINSNIKIIGLFDSTTEAIDFISKHSPDIIFLPSLDFALLKKITNSSYHPNIILFTNTPRSRTFSNILYLSTKTNICTMKKTINSFINSKSLQKLNLKIKDILLSFHFNLSLNGTKYLIDSIMYSYINKNDYVYDNLERKVYTHIAEKYHSNVHNIKWSIVRSINNMYLGNTTSSIKKINSYFNLEHLEKPTAKLIISTIVNKI